MKKDGGHCKTDSSAGLPGCYCFYRGQLMNSQAGYGITDQSMKSNPGLTLNGAGNKSIDES